jgi:membrane protein DedA with SNARE-associated domain
VQEAVFAWVVRHGYLGLSSLLLLGIVGLPVPDETLLLFAGYLVYRGDLRLVPTVGAALAGSAAGITLSYAIGRTLGHSLVLRYGWLVHFGAERAERASRWFARGGKWTLTFGYFIPGFRHLAALMAGASDLPAGPFTLCAYPGALLWCATFIGLGKAFGKDWQWMGERIHAHLVMAALLLAASLVVYWLLRTRINARPPGSRHS